MSIAQSARKVHWSPPLLEADDQEAAIQVIRSGWMTQNKQTEAFEKELAAVCGAKHAVVVNNGTSALIAALIAAGIKAGDEVLVPTLTFIATVNSVLLIGAKPILVDCDAKTLNMCLEDLERKITPKTKAILFVDVYGMPNDIEALQKISAKHGITLIEDAAESIGASYKGKSFASFSHLSILSFHMAKLVPTVEGGCVFTQDDETATYLKRIRNHGGAAQYQFVTFGLNLRITDIQSAIGRNQLKKLPAILSHRQKLVGMYKDALKGLVTFQEIPSYVTSHPHMIFAFFLKDKATRDKLNTYLNQNGVDTRICWPPIHRQPYHQPLFADQGPFPNSDSLSERNLSLPLGNALTEDEVQYVIQVTKEGLRNV